MPPECWSADAGDDGDANGEARHDFLLVSGFTQSSADDAAVVRQNVISS
jgi:hypothetical protein